MGLHASLAMRICFQLRFIIAAQQLSDACSYDFLDKSSTSTHFRHFLYLPRDYMPPNLNFTSVYCPVLIDCTCKHGGTISSYLHIMLACMHICVYAYFHMKQVDSPPLVFWFSGVFVTSDRASSSLK